MPLGLISTGQTISGAGVALKLNARFKDTYAISFGGVEQYYKMLFEAVPSTMALETYAYRKTAPYVQRWATGSSRGTKGFGSVRWSVTNYDWTDGVSWGENDKNDDGLHNLEQDARRAGETWATLWCRINAQLKEGTTDADLLPAIPNAPDGVDLYNATDGDGNARFGVTGGNIEDQTGTGNAAQVRKDFHDVLTRMRRFKNPQNQPLLDPSWFTQGYLIEYPPELTEVMREAFIQSRTVQTMNAAGANAATGSNLAVANVTNVVLESGDRIILWCNPWLTDTGDWYVTLIGAPIKPLIHQTRQPIREIPLLMNTPGAEHAAFTKEESLLWDSREGFGVALPFTTVQVH